MSIYEAAQKPLRKWIAVGQSQNRDTQPLGQAGGIAAGYNPNVARYLKLV